MSYLIKLCKFNLRRKKILVFFGFQEFIADSFLGLSVQVLPDLSPVPLPCRRPAHRRLPTPC